MGNSLDKIRRQIAIVIFGIACSFSTISAIIHYTRTEDWLDWLADAFLGFALEAFGAVLVIWLVDRTISSLQGDIDKHREKDELIFRLSNPNDNTLALESLRLLRDRGYVTDGSLSGKKLHWAQLQKANLQEADLRETNLGGANLHGASLWHANLQGAIFGSAQLQNANLGGAKLQGADLHSAKLAGATLDENTIFDENTILPDGSKWTSGIDMAKFTAKPKIVVGVSRYA